uniref:Piwi domain-containing protein n=1 Tax=Panagrellus redivivus TaxID=6233 RepID=A0A7E4VSP5_PANRE
MHRSQSSSSGRSSSSNYPYNRTPDDKDRRFDGDRGPGRAGGGDRRNLGPSDSQSLHNVKVKLGPVMAQPPASIPVVMPKEVQCNATKLDIRRAKPVWQYEMKLSGFRGKGENEVGVEIFRAAANDASKNSKYLAFNQIFLRLLEDYPSFFKSDEKDDLGNHKNLYVFDRSCLFYCSLDLLGTAEERKFTIESSKIPYQFRDFVHQFKTIEARLVKSRKLDIANAMTLPVEAQRPILQYLDILFDQFAYQQDKFLVFGDRMFFKDEGKEILSPNFLLKPGLQKNVRVTKECLVFQVDSKNTVFYAPQPLLSFLDTMRVPSRDLESPECSRDVLELLRGIAVRTTHLNAPRTFIISKMAKTSAKDTFFDRDGTDVSVCAYFAERYKRKLKYPEFLCVENRGSYYPIEVLEIIPGQRVPRHKMSDDLTAAMIKNCQMTPVQLNEKLRHHKEHAGFFNGNPILRASGVRIASQHIEARGQEVPAPIIIYKDSIQHLRQPNWRQGGGQYCQSGTIRKLAVVVDRRAVSEASQWIQKLVGQARSHGLLIEKTDVQVMECSSRDFQGIHETAGRLAKEGFDFLLFLSDSKDLHEAIKFSELKTRVPTQQVDPRSLRKGADTNGNIIHKMNLKSGGRNFEISTAPNHAAQFRVDLVKSLLTHTVIVAIEMSHPGAQSRFDRMMNIENPEPTSVGIAHTHDASGNIQHGRYFYVPRGSTVIKQKKLTDIVKNAIREFRAKQGHYPQRILIYRSGVSEGSFGEVIEHECSNIVNALKADSMTPAITMVVIQRKSNHRLLLPAKVLDYMSDKARPVEQNVTPGTCITSDVTNPRYPEFIMTSQRAILGTSKPIVGTIIFESNPRNRLPLDHLTQLTNALCYHLEIVTAPIALPAPLQSASHLAMRGLSNWKHALKIGAIKELGRELQMPPEEKEQLTKEQYDEMVQKALDRHSAVLDVTITNRRFWA